MPEEKKETTGFVYTKSLGDADRSPQTHFSEGWNIGLVTVRPQIFPICGGLTLIGRLTPNSFESFEIYPTWFGSKHIQWLNELSAALWDERLKNENPTRFEPHFIEPPPRGNPGCNYWRIIAADEESAARAAYAHGFRARDSTEHGCGPWKKLRDYQDQRQPWRI